MKKLFKISVSKVYIAYLLLLTVFVIGTYSSYAYFTVNKEKRNAIKMITGNLVGELKVDGEISDKLVVSAKETITFEIEVINKNNREARFNFYYKGELPENVEAGYVEGDGYNPMVKETGVNLTPNGSLGYYLKYQIKVKNNTGESITIPLGYEIGLDYNDLSLPENCYLFEKTNAEPTAVDVLLANYTNDESIQDYDVNYTKTDKTAKENKMYVFNHSAGTQQSDWRDDELKDYRYIGADPNNYVTFNDEVWRIIGIETVDNGSGKREKRIKLIRDEPLNSLSDFLHISWDNKPSGTGSSESSEGSNDWTDSRLMYLLNPDYEMEQTGVNGSIYWNRQSGNCPNDQDNKVETCNFTNTGLTSNAKNMIGDAKWYLGGLNLTEQSMDEFYYKERGDITCTTTKACMQSRPTSWVGRVGLMYPSDYGYATSGGESETRDYCLSNLDGSRAGAWNLVTKVGIECIRGDWIFKQEYCDKRKYLWFLSPRSASSNVVHLLDLNGFISNYSASRNNVNNFGYFVVNPTVYLKANVLYQNGDGSKTNPFVFASIIT